MDTHNRWTPIEIEFTDQQFMLRADGEALSYRVTAWPNSPLIILRDPEGKMARLIRTGPATALQSTPQPQPAVATPQAPVAPAQPDAAHGDWAGDWVVVRGDAIFGVRLAASGMGSIVTGLDQGTPFGVLRLGDQLALLQPPAGQVQYRIAPESTETSLLLDGSGETVYLTRRDVFEAAQRGEPAAPSIDAASARLVGHWLLERITREPNFTDINLYLADDGAFAILRNRKTTRGPQPDIVGGRFHVENGDRLILRTGKWLGTRFELGIDHIEPGRSLTLSYADDAGSVTEVYRYAGREHPLGADTQLTPMNMVGMYLFRDATRRWMWDFRTDGTLFRDQGTEFVADDYSVDGNRLTVSTRYRTYRFTIADFRRGQALVIAEPNGGESVFAYVEGPHRPPPADTQPPTGREAALELQRILAEHQRTMGSINMQNQAIDQQRAMMDGIAHDIAGRNVEWVWRE